MQNIKVLLEIPQGSKVKYEYDRESNKLVVDRILRDQFKYPSHYGCIENTLDWDGDELDVLIYSKQQFIPNVLLEVKIVGAMKMIDDKETDTKLIGVHANEHEVENIQSLSDLPKQFLDDIKNFFSNYKNWKRPNITKVLGFEDQKWAEQEYLECLELMKNYGHLKKADFIKLMRQKHPEKYEI